MTDTTLRTRRDGRVLRVTIDNPPVNAMSAVVMRELRDLLTTVRDDDDLRVIVFDSADPEYFIAHVDMHLAEQMDLLGELAREAPKGVNVFQAVGELLRQQPQVTIVELAGIARGGGAEFVAAADLTFAARETARIGQIEALMGIVPSGGGTQYLLERVGRNRALELVLTGDAVDADTAAAYGWVNRAFPAADLAAEVDRIAEHIAALPDGVAAAAKRILAPITPLDGYAHEESEWAALISRPVTTELMGRSLELGAQTAAGSGTSRDSSGGSHVTRVNVHGPDCPVTGVVGRGYGRAMSEPGPDLDPRTALESERARSGKLLADVERSMRDVSDARDGANVDDEHDPEGATLAWERGSLGAVRDDAVRRLDLVDRALARLDAGTYGRCAVGGEPIPAARLAAVPWAVTCVAHAG